MYCHYDLAYIGLCGKPMVDDYRCKEHLNTMCCSCGELATHQCCEASRFTMNTDGSLSDFNDLQFDGFMRSARRLNPVHEPRGIPSVSLVCGAPLCNNCTHKFSKTKGNFHGVKPGPKKHAG